MILKKTTHKVIALTALLALFVTSIGLVSASSHREAPLISADPQADGTDLYAFVSPDRPDTVTLIANYLPFEEPAGGPNFYSFGSDVVYEIKIDNNADATEDISYQFRFTNTRQNDNTFLYNTGPITSLDDPDFNVRQTYSLTRVQDGVSTVLGTNLPVPPVNIGPKSTPNYAELQAMAVKDLDGGIKTFAGQSDDPFFVDFSLFDLLTIRNLPGNKGGGINGLAGYNVQTLALQVPINQLTKNKTKPTSNTDAAAVVGFWTTASRQSTTVIGANPSVSGPLVQVSRLGAPLVNEVVLPLGQKDKWNGSKPKDDAQFANYVTDPELGKLLNGLYGIAVPPQGLFGTDKQRDDLIAIFLTGVPNLTNTGPTTPSEQLRLNVAVPPSANPNRLGVLGGDLQGYPNGRRLADDVTDISIKAVAGAAYPLFHPGFTPDPTGVQLGDGVDFNEQPFRSTFPYVALPNQGLDSVPHGQIASDLATDRMTFYRLVNTKSGNHFYTSNMTEMENAKQAGYTEEGNAGYISSIDTTETVPLYRLYSPTLQDHFYTTMVSERDMAMKASYISEGVAGYIPSHPLISGTTSLFRLYNPSTSQHFFTINSEERDQAINQYGYKTEGQAGLVYIGK